MALQVGSRLRCPRSQCEVIVLKGTASDEPLLCGGSAMTTDGVTGEGADGPLIALGKRYVDNDAGIEVLCTKAGPGPLTFEGRELVIKAANALPSSD